MLRGSHSSFRAQPPVVHVLRSLMDLPSPGPFLHLHPPPLPGHRAELWQRLLPSCSPLKCQYLVTPRGPDATQAGSTPANPSLPGQGPGRASKGAAMRINCLVKEEGSSALNGNNGRLHGLLSHNIIKDKIKGREYSKWLAGKTC